jgi:transposase
MPRARHTSSRQAKSAKARFNHRYKRVEDMPVIHRHAAGIDLGGDVSHFVALEIEDEIEVREFGGMTPDLQAMLAYLGEHQVTTVAMEATGVYWMPVYDVLEAVGIEVYLVNPTHVKNVPGRRKDDKLDARWLQKLHKYGLLSASFRPSEEIRPLYTLQRNRSTLIRLSADEVRRMQKALDVMNVRIHKAISDLCGATGMRIVRAIVKGERDPAKLAAMRDPGCRATEEELCAALTGNYQRHLVLELSLALERYDHIIKQIGAIDAEMESCLKALIPLPAEERERRLAEDTHELPKGHHAPAYNVAGYVQLATDRDPTCLPGLAAVSVLALLALLGKDMNKWATRKHFVSFLTLAPNHKISGGKVLSSRTRPGRPPAAQVFLQAAVVVSRMDTALGAYYRRLAVRIGTGRARVATAAKIAGMYYDLMRDGQAFVEAGAAEYEERYRRQQLVGLERKAKQFGMALVPAAA